MARIDVLRSVRRFCLECQGESPQEVAQCADAACALWTCRMAGKDGEPLSEDAAERALVRASKAHEALRAIRRQCLACAGDRKEVRLCAAKEQCPLWSLRFGVRPETYKNVRRRFFAPKALTLF